MNYLALGEKKKKETPKLVRPLNGSRQMPKIGSLIPNLRICLIKTLLISKTLLKNALPYEKPKKMLSAKRKREIEGRVNRLLDICGCLNYPLPINLNLPLTYLRFTVHSAEEVPCPCLERDFAPIIFLPVNLASQRKRFRIAHEIAHQYLGHYQQQKEVLDSPRQNREAGYFAACLLMPAKLFKLEWEDAEGEGRDLVRIIAQKFQVSRATTRIRAEELKLLNNRGVWYED